MDCTEKILVVCGEWTNIYGWGNGFYSSDKAREWHKFWNELEAKNGRNYWKCSIDNTFRTPYLFSTHGSIYIHPMNFTAFLNFDTVNSYDGVISELNKICKDVAEKCGSDFHMVIEEKRLEHNLCIAEMKNKSLGFKVIS